MLSEEARLFYKKVLAILEEKELQFMIGGGLAVSFHTGIQRDTKDMDIFCRVEDYPAIIHVFKEKGFYTEITDSRWLAKVYEGNCFIDIIFNSPNNMCRVDDSWFAHAVAAEIIGQKSLVISPEEIIWCKIYVQSRNRFDGADIHHLFLTKGKDLDWQRLLRRLDLHWPLLLAHLITFQFVYPADYREIVPEWVYTELLQRLNTQFTLPTPIRKVCLGPLIDQKQYKIDIENWGYEVINI